MLSGILLESISIRKGVWKIKWKKADLEVFSDILFEKKSEFNGFYVIKKWNRNLR